MSISVFIRFQNWITKPRILHYAAIISGILCPLFFFAGFIAAGFIPPLKPWHSVEHVANHYRNHEGGARVGASLILLSGMFYLPYLNLISTQMERIPGAVRGLGLLQLSSGSASVWTFMIPGMILALAAYRTDRDENITRLLNDAFWIFAVMPFPTFIVQNWAFAIAILSDSRPRPLFPRYVGFINLIMPILFSPALGLHCVKSGVVSWSGALTFWVPAVGFGLQFGIDCFSLFNAVRTEDDQLNNSENSPIESKGTSSEVPYSASNGQYA